MVSGGTNEVGVVVADDHVVFRQIAHHVIDPTPDFALLGEASSGEHALLLVAELRPELVLVDVRMPGMDGIEAATRILAENPSTVVVLISLDRASVLPPGASSCGAAAIVRKQDFGVALLRRLWAEHGPARHHPIEAMPAR
jgi:two-component system invasion response regulator UvrY